MNSIRVAAVAMLAACGAAALGQTRPGYELSAPYEDVFRAVTEAGCERKETRSYIRFFCEEGQAFWYFTQVGRPEHPGYRALPSYWGRENGAGTASRALRQINGFGRFDSAEKRDAYLAWMREVSADSAKSATDPGLIPKFKREPRGKLYPLEP
jgi:hypothetical protein